MSELTKRIAGLSPTKRNELLARLQKKNGEVAHEPIRRRGRESNTFPQSFAQERLWVLEQLEPGNPAYNIVFAMRLSGAVDLTTLERTFNEILKRHEILRTGFKTVNGQPVQLIEKEVRISLPLFDLSELHENEKDVEVDRHLSEIGQTSFDMSQAPLLRARLLRREDTSHIFLLCIHHIVTDGWSMDIFSRELATVYESLSTGQPVADMGNKMLPELPIQYADFSAWQREWLQGEVLEHLLSYWKPQLANLPPNLELPTDRPHPAMQTFTGAVYPFKLSEELFGALWKMSQMEGATLFMTLLAVLKILLYKYTGQEDIIVGSPIANRNRHEVEDLIGFFVNTLVLRTDLSGNPTFRELLLRVRNIALKAYEHQDLPFEKLVEAIQPERNLSTTPFFQTMLVLHKPQGEKPQTLRKLKFGRTELLGNSTAKYDLTLYAEQRGNASFSLAFEYNTDLFDATTIERMAGHFRTILEATVSNPDQRLSEIPLLTGAERKQLLIQWNATEKDYPRGKCLHYLLEEQVKRTPDAVSVVFDNQRLTYLELNERANQLAHQLRKLGVGQDVLVGISVERSLEMVVGLYGILKAGGAYVPLDPAYPKERLGFILEDAQVPVLLTQQSLLRNLPDHNAHVICLDTDWEAIAKGAVDNLACNVINENLAYVIYTSGSTGKPKGVAIAHRNAVAMIHWAGTVFDKQDFQGVLASTSICFDLSVFEFFVPLSWGGKVILAENALALPNLLAREEVTLVNTVPSAMTELVQQKGIPASVRTVNLAGEPLQPQLVDEIYEQRVERVFDLYGPSEDTTYSTYALRQRGGPATIGRPIANTKIYILDHDLQPVPIGVRGEMYIGGHGVVRGYLARPKLTAEKFIPNPFSDEPGARLYNTGDLARYLPNGNIEFVGRIDHQVKIRGFRIELGEIESKLSHHEAIDEVVVVAREEDDDRIDKRLVAYLVSKAKTAPRVSDLRRFLMKSLPEYMVPSAFVFLDALPLTPNGKVDRKGFPAPSGLHPELESAFVAPQNEVERAIAKVWQEVLGVENVGIDDNFFELGGHSLLAMRLISQLYDSFQVELPLRKFFEQPSVSGIAKAMLQNTEQKRRVERTAGLLLKMSQLSDDQIKTMLEKKNVLTEVSTEHE